MNKEDVLLLVDSIMHKHASAYRNEAREMVESKFSIDNKQSESLLCGVSGCGAPLVGGYCQKHLDSIHQKLCR